MYIRLRAGFFKIPLTSSKSSIYKKVHSHKMGGFHPYNGRVLCFNPKNGYICIEIKTKKELQFQNIT